MSLLSSYSASHSSIVAGGISGITLGIKDVNFFSGGAAGPGGILSAPAVVVNTSRSSMRCKSKAAEAVLY